MPQIGNNLIINIKDPKESSFYSKMLEKISLFILPTVIFLVARVGNQPNRKDKSVRKFLTLLTILNYMLLVVCYFYMEHSVFE